MRGARVLGALGLVVCVACGEHEGPGEIRGGALPRAWVEARAAQQAAAARELGLEAPPKQILFGDLHVHTTYSPDAFMWSLPWVGGEGAHPPADACDFARYCADLDFWSINDHDAGSSPQRWRETKESIRQCNAVAGDPRDPDLVSYIGWEWTQVGGTPETHYGHKNVIFRELDEERVAPRVIASSAGIPEWAADVLEEAPSSWGLYLVALSEFPESRRYWNYARYARELSAGELCPEGVDTRELPADCREVARTPAQLFEKLRQGGYDALVIPHGTTWGLYTPPGSTLEKQLAGAMHDPERQTLFEVYSGHGNSEEYRDWRGVELDAEGRTVCPAPTEDYLPCCWQAGEILRARCKEPASAECEALVEEGRTNAARAGPGYHRTVPGATVEDWKHCGQCEDCFLPAFNYVPATSAQAALALGNFEGPEPRRFRFGFIASSDNHSARPGTGYKAYERRRMTEAVGPRDATWASRLYPPRDEPEARSVPRSEVRVTNPLFQLFHLERQSSFFLTGGLVAVHASGRDRDAIWEALRRKEVYGTSGPRILLWFDLLNGPGPLPMGSEVVLSEAPRFRVRAAGALEQRPGCPEHAVAGLDPERLDLLCRGECYNPGDRRHPIVRIEVVRVRPQVQPGEAMGSLVEDPWRVLSCHPEPSGCTVEFSDPELPGAGREHVYYVRAVQEATPTVNGGGLRCERDAEGRCVRVHPCYGDYRTAYDDDCLAPAEHRAWSSPIYIRPG